VLSNGGDWKISLLMSTVSYFINLFDTRLILETSFPVFVVLNEERWNGWVSSLAARKASLHQSIFLPVILNQLEKRISVAFSFIVACQRKGCDADGRRRAKLFPACNQPVDS